jgi:hypothetical protein
LGGISGEFSSIPITRRRYPDTEQRIATHSLRRKMARSQAERDPAYHRKAETIRRGESSLGMAVQPEKVNEVDAEPS